MVRWICTNFWNMPRTVSSVATASVFCLLTFASATAVRHAGVEPTPRSALAISGASRRNIRPTVAPTQQQLEDGDEQKKEGVKTASGSARLDPANFLVVIIAALLLIYCCHRALRPPFLDMEKMSTREREEMRELEEAGEMELHSAFLFVVVASVALMLIFYFMSAMSGLITCLFSFVATIALGAAFYPYVDNWTGNRFSHETDVPLLGSIPTLAFVLAPFCLLIVALWLCTKSWILNNVLAMSLIVFFLTTIRISSLMVNTCLLVLAFFYDIFWVFCSSAVFGSNVRKCACAQKIPLSSKHTCTLVKKLHACLATCRTPVLFAEVD